MAGDYSCKDRIDWLINVRQESEFNACRQVSKEYPDICGSCNPDHCPRGGSCGNGNIGDGRCSSGECCSEHGWCGTSPAHCTNPAPIKGGGSCGNGSRGDGRCPSGECCSEWGWCGTSVDHCN